MAELLKVVQLYDIDHVLEVSMVLLMEFSGILQTTNVVEQIIEVLDIENFDETQVTSNISFEDVSMPDPNTVLTILIQFPSCRFVLIGLLQLMQKNLAFIKNLILILY